MQINYKFLKSTDKMERITRSELAANLDDILEKIDKNDVGMVITEDGKRDLVICPAYWFNFCFDDDFGCIINSAVRYALGRYTYMPSTVASFVRKYLAIIDTKTIGIMLEDINKALEDEKLPLRETWWSLKCDLEAHLKEEP